ncbi:transcription elongation factor subunit Spt4 [Undibacterium luofuense]|uniref:transcription elongation factor subunit Spt4 n=1 Tax=Undibacterium luofuense TaxID=2828733 RepID=UPI003C6F13B1
MTVERKVFVDKGDECPECHTSDLTTNWKGRMIIIDSENSEIAKKVGVKKAGEYAIKTR